MSSQRPNAEPLTNGTTPQRTMVVVPTFNERSNVDELVPRFFALNPAVHLLVVDDNSPDGTADRVEELSGGYPQLHILRRNGARGLGFAYVAGIAHALAQSFDIIGTMDADVSHDPAHLPEMLKLLKTHDVVIGSRYIPGGGTVNWSAGRVALSWTANKFAAVVLQLPAHDVTSGYRLYRRGAVEWIRDEPIHSTGYSFLGELLYRAHRRGARIAESPIIFHDRTAGVSKLHKREIYRGAFNLLRLRLSR